MFHDRIQKKVLYLVVNFSEIQLHFKELKPPSKDDFKAAKDRSLRKKSGENPGGCPAEIKHKFQYGPGIKAVSVYASAYQFILLLRTKQMTKLVGVKLSTGTLDYFRKSASRNLPSFMAALRLSIINSAAGFFDEASIKVRGKGHWVQVAATGLFSFFALHPKRGSEAHDSMGIPAFLKGLLHRDDYRSYPNYLDAIHALCCVRFRRNLIHAIGRDGQNDWADLLIKLSVKIKRPGRAIPQWHSRPALAGAAVQRVPTLCCSGTREESPDHKRGRLVRERRAQSKTVNLLLRLRNKEDELLRFRRHEHARFDNNQNQLEQRMNKARQKVPGGFRSLQGGMEFMDIRSFIAAAIKQGLTLLEGLYIYSFSMTLLTCGCHDTLNSYLKLFENAKNRQTLCLNVPH